MTEYEQYLANETERMLERSMPRDCVECGDPADDTELCAYCAVQEVAA